MRIKTHPGEILKEEFMIPSELSANKLAKYLDVPLSRIIEIISGKRGITANTALRLSKFFNTDARFWMNLQVEYDLSVARRDLADVLENLSTACGRKEED
jgi:addiction module HigA family antidote